MRRLRKNVLWAIVAAAVAVSAVVAVLWLAPGGSPGPRPTEAFGVQNETSALGPVYHPGIILGAASNGSVALLGGIGVYTKVPEYTLPDLASATVDSGQVVVTNLTPAVNPYFFEGGVYAMGWNGSAWLLGGQAGWGGGSHNAGSLVAFSEGRFVNRTTLLGTAFAGGGVFAMGWNGSAWLLGGNSTTGPALESIAGGKVTNLSAKLPLRDPSGWLQTIDWNGNEWLIGGEGVFGLLTGSNYTDLWDSAPFGGSGVYAADWNGSVWLAGGGAAALVTVRGQVVQSAPPLSGRFDQSVTFVAAVPGGWLLGGTGTSSAGGFAPELAYWDGSGPTATSLDLTAELPSAFLGGDLQAGCLAPAFGPDRALVVGEGQYNNETGFGLGAMALVTFPPA